MKLENQIQIFNNPEFGQIRTILINGEIWFVAADVCRALDLGDTSKAVSRLKENEKGTNNILTPGGEQEMLIVNEPGLYRLIFTSRKPNAEKFQDWVYHEVLPSIRKYGYYVAPNTIFDFNLVAKLIPEINLTDDQMNFLKLATPMLSTQASAMIKRLLSDYGKNTNVTDLIVLDMLGEIWKDVNKFLGLYQISTEGRIKSFHRGKVKIIEPNTNEDGYLNIGLYKDGKTITYAVHRLVAEAFIPNPLNLPEVDHRDNNPANNRVTNLRWCTRKQNMAYAVENGVYKFGDDHPRSKLTVEKVREIREKYIPRSKKFGIKALAEEYGVSRSTIENVVYNQVWKHVK